jgi:hypothetical protein
MPNIVGITMPFPSQGVCLMPYCGLMPYAMQFPASQLGSRMKVCLMRGSTVVIFELTGTMNYLPEAGLTTEIKTEILLKHEADA